MPFVKFDRVLKKKPKGVLYIDAYLEMEEEGHLGILRVKIKSMRGQRRSSGLVEWRSKSKIIRLRPLLMGI